MASWIADLQASMPDGRVSVDEKARAEFAQDRTELPGAMPDAVVRVTSTEEVVALVRFASRHGVPLVPVVANTNLGGLALPTRGGIVVDFRTMDRVIEVNESDLYMVVEPGVTWEKAKAYLDAHHPKLRLGYPLSPPDSSVLANALLDGLVNLSVRYGSMSRWLNGVEAVLADGTVVRTGSAAMSPVWCSGPPLPDLTGLFINMQGTTGLVTRGAIQLWPSRRLRRRSFYLVRDLEPALSTLRELAREEEFDDLGYLSWPLGKMIFGEERPTHRDPSEPVAFIYVDYASDHEQGFRWKRDLLIELLRARKKSGMWCEGPIDVTDLVRIEPKFSKFAEFPTRLDFLLDTPGGGLTWVGTYGPTSRWEEGARIGVRIMEERGWPPCLVARAMLAAHFGVLRFISVFDKKDPAQVSGVLELNQAIVDALLPMGFLPYKTPGWVLERHAGRLDPGFAHLLGKVRSTLDPGGIFNPGRWPVPTQTPLPVTGGGNM